MVNAFCCNLVLVTWEREADKRPSSPQVICRLGVRAPQEERQLVSEALTQTWPRPAILLRPIFAETHQDADPGSP